MTDIIIYIYEILIFLKLIFTLSHLLTIRFINYSNKLLELKVYLTDKLSIFEIRDYVNRRLFLQCAKI